LEVKQIINFKKKFLAREVAKLVVLLYSQSRYCVNIHEDFSSVIFYKLQEFEDAARVEVQLQVSGVQNKMSHAKWHTREFILEAKQVINLKKNPRTRSGKVSCSFVFARVRGRCKSCSSVAGLRCTFVKWHSWLNGCFNSEI